MSIVIRAADPNLGASGVAFNFDDMAAQAKGYLDRVRAEAVKIVARAQQEADAVRRRAELEGRQAALQAGVNVSWVRREAIISGKAAFLAPEI